MTAWGLDCSYFQRPSVGPRLDLRTLPVQGYEFATARIAYGVSFADPAWPVYRQQAEQTGSLLFSGYHFLLASHSAQAQADFVAAHIGDTRIPVAIDCEASGGANMGQVEAFATALQKNGLKVGKLYLPRSWWAQIGRPTVPSEWGLWNAAYPSPRSAFASLLYPGDGHPDWQAYAGHAVDVWQFASTALAAGYMVGNLDVNAYRGTRAQLAATGWFHDFTPAPPTPPKPPAPPAPPTPENNVALTDQDIEKVAEAMWARVFTVDPHRLGWSNAQHTAADVLYASLVLSSDARNEVRALAAQVAQIPGVTPPQAAPAVETGTEAGQ